MKTKRQMRSIAKAIKRAKLKERQSLERAKNNTQGLFYNRTKRSFKGKPIAKNPKTSDDWKFLRIKNKFFKAHKGTVVFMQNL